jgi:hypothetical protein
MPRSAPVDERASRFPGASTTAERTLGTMIASEPPSHDKPAQVRPEDAWSLLTTPMTKEDVLHVADYIDQKLPGFDVIPADPRKFLIGVWDRWTAEMIRAALGSLKDAGGLVPDGLLRDLDEWLARADPYDEDEDPWPEFN